VTTPELSGALGGDDAVRRAFEAVAAVLLKKGRVEIDGFGAFELQKRKARRARNPRTGERIDLPAKVVVKFKPASALKRQAEQLPDVPGGA
jgi:nucleoid DNA-binding protein